MQNFNFGKFAEYYAALWYQIRFYHILARRMRNIAGEIDLIATRGKNLVFIEVKARNNMIDSVVLLPRQQTRVRRAAEVFIARYPKYQDFNMRFDLVLIRPYKFPEVIFNAW